MSIVLQLLLAVLICATPAKASDVVILAWSPVDDSKIGRAYERGDTITVPEGYTAKLISSSEEVIVLKGPATFQVPPTPEPSLITAVARMLQGFSGVFRLRSMETSEASNKMWMIDPKQSGPQCVEPGQMPELWVAAGSKSRDFEIRHKTTGKNVFIRIEDANTSLWPASLPVEDGGTYVFRDLYDQTVTERTFKLVTKSGSTDLNYLQLLLDAGCTTQARIAIEQLPQRTLAVDPLP